MSLEPGSQGAPKSSGNALSVLAICFGTVALLFLPIVFGPVGIVLASVAFAKSERLAAVGLAVSILGTLLGLFLGFLIWAIL